MDNTIIVEENDRVKVSECCNTGNITGNRGAGGIVGTAAQYMSLIEKCYNTGIIEAEVQGAGGIVATLGRSSQIKNCYNTGNVKGVTYVGGILGSSYNSTNKDGILINCYNIGDVRGNEKVDKILGGFTYEPIIINCMEINDDIKTNFINDSNNNIWEIRAGENSGYPVLRGM